MDLTNEFTVGVPIERAWAVLTDLERIAPCMPGAQLQEVEGDEYRGLVKVKVGPITAQYKGSARFAEQDEPRRAVLRAEGRETRGQGGASATITATLEPAGDGTKVVVATDLTVSGKVAQFGRGVLADVSAKLLGQFVDCLESTVLGDEGTVGDEAAAEPTPAAPAEPPPAAPPEDSTSVAAATSGDGSRTRRIESAEPAPVDLVGTAGAPVAKRLLPVAAIVAAWWLLRRLTRRRRR